jgi:hypothetical protein
MVTGLLAGDEFAPREITAAQLREIRPGEILAELLADYDPDEPPTWVLPDAIAAVADVNARIGNRAERPPRGPDEETLREFARYYLTEYAPQPRRAMTLAARKYNISRATANRWAQMCRDRGFLPNGGTK